MTIQQEFKSAARLADSLIYKAHPSVSLAKLINRLSVPERMTMQNEIARIYAELVDQALQHVDPNGKNHGLERHIEQILKRDAVDGANFIPDHRSLSEK